MSIDFLISILENIENPKRVNRQTAANIVLDRPELLEYVVKITFDVDDKLSIKAAWILEWICSHHGIVYITPYLDSFTANLKNLHFDSAIRPCAKICEHIAVQYTSKKDNEIKMCLSQHHIDVLVEIGFDWLITEQKIAVRAYTMNMLYLLGLHRNWVHKELEHLIRSKIIHESKGCKARGQKILALLKENNLS